jgi:hypothetical protein
LAVFGISSTTALCHPDEAESLGLANGGSNGVVVNSICLEILERHWQLAVIIPAVVRQFD